MGVRGKGLAWLVALGVGGLVELAAEVGVAGLAVSVKVGMLVAAACGWQATWVNSKSTSKPI